MDQPDSSLDNWLDGIDLSENAPDDAAVLLEPVDLKALLLRRFTWDTMLCSEVAELLPKLGLTLSTPEGTDHEHAESHHRMAMVFPFEPMFREYATILATVLSTAVMESQGVTGSMSTEDQLGFVRQNAELILSSGRAMVAQLMFMGLLGYGPNVEVRSAHLDADGNVVLDDPPAEDTGQLDGQLSFDDVEPGSE